MPPLTPLRIMLAALVAVSALLVLPCKAADRSASEYDIAAMLFPETKAWPRLETYPHPDADWFAQQREQLRRLALDRRRGWHLEESATCSTITHLLDNPGSRDRFFYFDLRGAGNPTLLYAGSAQCREGSLTVIWPNAETGPSRQSIEERPYRILTVLTGSSPQWTGIAEGCCGDPLNTYYRATPENTQVLRLPFKLVLPRQATPLVRRLIVSQELLLRSAPEIKDDYDKSESQFLNHAAFGNILRKYLDGVECDQRLRYVDGRGREWALVIVSPEADVRSYHTPMNANVGWLELRPGSGIRAK